MTVKQPSGRIQKPQDESQPRQMKLNQLGKIRVGEKVKKKTGNREVEYPRSLDYFKATGKYAEKFNAAYPDKPSEIGIVFVSDNITDVCNERFELRDKGGKKIAEGDGETFKVWHQKEAVYKTLYNSNEKDRKVLNGLATQWTTDDYTPEWKSILTLKFVIPKVNDVFGIWVFETKGVNSSIPNIRDTFDMVKEMAGTVINVPFDLTVEKVKSQHPGDTNVYPVVTLIPNISKDRMEDVAAFLNQGNKVQDIKKLLEGEITEDQKLLESQKVDEQKKDIKQHVQKQGPVHVDGQLF